MTEHEPSTPLHLTTTSSSSSSCSSASSSTSSVNLFPPTPTSSVDPLPVRSISSVSEKLPTHQAAELVLQDYLLNGHRCRSESSDFIPPRMVPDLEVTACMRCQYEFTLFNRRHHCRACGNIFCHTCSSQKLLLEKEYKFSDPQRVCESCFDRLSPLQSKLTSTVANKNRTNVIDTQSYSRYMNLPYSKTLGSELRKAAYSVSNMFHPSAVGDSSYVLQLLQQAQGLAFLTVIKGGLVFAPRVGTGLVVSRLPDGRWSAPTAIATVGISWGALVGIDVTDYVIVLRNLEAVTAFASTAAPSSAAASWNPLNSLSFSGVRISGEVDVALGSFGRVGYSDLHVGENGAAATAFSYCHSRGLYAGLSLGGSLMFARPEVNANFYGRAYTPLQLLSGEVPPPFAGNCLYEALYDSVDYLVGRQLLRENNQNNVESISRDLSSSEVSGSTILGRGQDSARKRPREKIISAKKNL